MKRARAVVVGIGSSLRGDDGVGPEVVRCLVRTGVPEGVDVVDAGADGMGLLDLLGGYARAVVVDCARMGRAPGSVRVFTPEDVESRRPAGRVTLHEVDPLGVVELGRRLGFEFELTLVGVEPADTRPGGTLSPAVRAAVPEAMAAAIRALETTGRDG